MSVREDLRETQVILSVGEPEMNELPVKKTIKKIQAALDMVGFGTDLRTLMLSLRR